ncbi:hypothetical protein PAXINDRAFT_101706 [Paxillus involutus ATCC 200175]|uniref:Uncharacterized protein n=1 Tax=Paxillus involutus ATCC 200175 TaxID=664439 RepID=A0A0C9TVK5_PAXIN|nr:hypothetical protein PAXINDRAFT_101706 [Paxillus involutus ATCC 200175]
MICLPGVSDETGEEATPGAGLNTVTHCSCSKNGGHLSEIALETVLPGTPDKIYNLMFANGFIKDFMKVHQKFIDVQMSDWAPISQGSNLFQRNMSYIRPLYSNVGPKQTKCEIHDESVHCDFDDHAVMLTTTKVPDVPSGGVFTVMTRTCFMWAGPISTRVIVTTQVEWTGRSFIKALIEKSAIEGQKVYYSDLDKAMRMYIQEYQSESIPEGIDPTTIAPVGPITPVAGHNGGGLEGAISGLALAEDNLDMPGSYNAPSRSMVHTRSVSDETGEEATPGAGLNKLTHCSCSKNDSHLSEVALETVLQGTPDKIYNLMFASGFIKDFMKVHQKFINVQMSDWAPKGSKLLQRNMSYIRPLYSDVGPKQTKCEIHDESVHCDFDDHVVMLTTTKAPDVPSGGAFVVMTRTCFMWASPTSTRVIVTTQVKWTGRSFIKGLIEKFAIEGQKVYYSDLDKAMRMYIQEYQSEFIPEGIDPTAVALLEPITPVAGHNGGGLEGAISGLALAEDNLDMPGSRNASMICLPGVSDETGEEATPGAGLNTVTHCSCSKNGSHLSEIALETVLPGTPDKIYNLMFTSGFIKDFMKVHQKFIDVQTSDWAPISQGSKLLQRNMSYIKPLYSNVGPKQTKCEIHDESVHCDFDDHAVMLTTTKTPDVPSGGVFAVMTRTCFMWASSISTRVIVTTQVEWTGRSFIKGPIEKSTIEWQKVYYSDLDKAIRMYIQEHQSEFIPEGIDPTAVALLEPITPVAEHNGGGLEGVISGEEARKAWERDRNRLGLFVNSVTAWSLNDIRSNFAHDLTGHVIQEGERPFASGSFGDIYRGTLRMKGRTIDVAVKAIRTYSVDDGDDAKKKKVSVVEFLSLSVLVQQVVQKFRRELKTWLNLDHINILPLFGTTTNFGQFPAMVCPWLENGSLTAYLERRYDNLTAVERLTLVSDVAAGLQYLHSRSVVHGDLSGANVLIHANERACISDFGLSTLLTQLGGSTFATTHQAPGTLRWTAPELLDFEEPEDEGDLPHAVPSPRSDVYSFGRIMLQILTGKVPYHYCVREAQVVHAMSRGVNPKRPSQELVTDRQWTFIERCWTPVNVDQSRPGDEEIVEFAKQELEMAAL